jgi:hypothetical protein
MRGIPQRIAVQNGAVVEQPKAIVMPNLFGAVLVQLAAVAETKLPQPLPQPLRLRLQQQAHQQWPPLQLLVCFSPQLRPLHTTVAAARDNHVTELGIPWRIAGQSGAVVEQPATIATPSQFGVALMLLAAVVEANLGGVSVVESHSEP